MTFIVFMSQLRTWLMRVLAYPGEIRITVEFEKPNDLYHVEMQLLQEGDRFTSWETGAWTEMCGMKVRFTTPNREMDWSGW